MTDEQIIIDGCDVSKCEFYNKDDKTCREVNGNYDTDICEFDKCENSNCVYKQLKRKENELEELRQYHNKCCEEFKKEKQNLIDRCNQFSKDFFIGKYCKKEYCNLLKVKEQECEELKKECEIWKNQVLTIDDETITVQITHQQFKDYNQLKAENDLYKNAHKTEQDRRRSYENALAEIKEIAEKQVKRAPDGETFSRPEIKQILQKISEVENE